MTSGKERIQELEQQLAAAKQEKEDFENALVVSNASAKRRGEQLKAAEAKLAAVQKSNESMMAAAMKTGVVFSCGPDGYGAEYNPEIAHALAQIDAPKEGSLMYDETTAELVRQLEAANTRIQELTEQSRTPEPCGHMANFQIGDEHGHFTCTICRAKTAEAKLRTARSVIVDAIKKLDWSYSNSFVSHIHADLFKALAQIDAPEDGNATSNT